MGLTLLLSRATQRQNFKAIALSATLVLAPLVAPAQAESPRQTSLPPRLIVVQLSRELFTPLAEKQVDTTTSVRDVILGTPIRGLARTTGQPQLDLFDDPESAAFIITLRGGNVSRTVGRNGPAIIYSRATTRFAAAKRIAFQPGQGFVAGPARVNAVTQTATEGIGSTRRGLIGRIVERRAAREVAELRPQVNAIARQRAEVRIRTAFDAAVEQRLARVNANPDLRHALALVSGKNGEPNYVCCTRDGSVLLAAAGEGALAGLQLPQVERSAPVQVWVHDSMVGGNLALFLKQFDSAQPGASLVDQALEVMPPVLKQGLGMPATVAQAELPLNYVTAQDWIVIQIDPQASASAATPTTQLAATRPQAAPARAAPQRVTLRDKPARPPAGNRIWTSSDGRFRVSAMLVSATPAAVTLKRADSGREVAVPWARLSSADQQFARTTGG
jgi:hypothetical protein